MSLKELINEYVEKHIGEFHDRRLESIQDSGLLTKILLRKNPYLYKAKHITEASNIVRMIVDAHLSSQEETLFGNWLERLAIFINETVYKGVKSSTLGIDLEFTNDGVRYLVVIKSGPNWGNANQIKGMKLAFSTALKTLGTSGGSAGTIRCVNGCCYGRAYSFDGLYEKICGQRFWELVSGDTNLYLDIIEPLGHKAKEKNEEFSEYYGAALTRLTEEFIKEYCTPEYFIDWNKITTLISSKDKPARKVAKSKKVKGGKSSASLFPDSEATEK